MADRALPDVVGLSLDGSTPYVITTEANRALCATMDRQPAPDGAAHPIFYHIAAQVGMRLTIDSLCAACDFDMADGPMLGSTSVEFARPLMTNRPYDVRGRVVDIARKRSGKFGVMDLVTYNLELWHDGEAAVSVTHTLVLPRGAKA